MRQAAFLVCFLWASFAYARCGTERWPVKTVTDAAISGDLIDATVASLGVILAPVNPDVQQDTRFEPTETTVFYVEATMTLIKHEADGDYHIVLSDDDGHTMIVEAPDPACAVDSYAADAIQAVRAVIDQHFGRPITGRIRLAAPVSVTGVGFFDRCHGQEGRALNCIELHPLLNIEFK